LKDTCNICKEEFDLSDLYEYRGAIHCLDCNDKSISKRDAERQEIIEEERHKTDRFRGLPLDDSPIGKANREILKHDIDIANKESKRLTDYEKRN